MTTHSAHPHYSERIRELAAEYASKGYSVIVRPHAPLPIDLGTYEPDLIATKGDGTGVLIEVKDKQSSVSVEQMMDIASRVARHHGWKFIVVTLDESSSGQVPDPNRLPTWEAIRARIPVLRNLVQESNFEPALLYWWGTFEAAMRRRAVDSNIPVERMPHARMLNHMYTLGEIQLPEYDKVRAILELRNAAAHGQSVEIQASFLNDAIRLVEELVARWSASDLH